MRTRLTVDRGVRGLLLAGALTSIGIVFLMGLSTVNEALPALRHAGHHHQRRAQRRPRH